MIGYADQPLGVDAELAAQGRSVGPDDEKVVVATGVPQRDSPTRASEQPRPTGPAE